MMCWWQQGPTWANKLAHGSTNNISTSSDSPAPINVTQGYLCR